MNRTEERAVQTVATLVCAAAAALAAGWMLAEHCGWFALAASIKTAAAVLVVAAGYLAGRHMGAMRRRDLPEIEPLDEADLIRVGLLGAQDAAVRAPLHVAEGMRVAKRESVGMALEQMSPGTTRAEQALWMAAGYVNACAEFERLWLKIREDAAAAGGEK